MKTNIASNEVIHFIGIGGIGMSGLAQIMTNMNFQIQGSDLNNNKNTDRLIKLGIKIYFGHNPNLVSVLDGGFKKWKLEKKITTNNKTTISKSKYKSQENKELVKDKNQINTNINKKEFVVIDARGKERFEGKVPEPRKNVRRGSIPNSLCLPYREIINENNTFKNIAEISKKFDEIIETNNENRVFSCGSGITACVLALAYSLVNNKYSPTIYDGSWAEYGKI